jgi:NitT/TauT family transport system permease protein
VRAADRRRTSWLRIREEVDPWTARGLGLLPLVLLYLLWCYLTHDAQRGMVESRIVSVSILPSPREMFSRDTLQTLWFQKELSRSAVVSLSRVVCGFSIAAAIAVPLGVLMGAFNKVDAAFRPLAVAGSYLPVAALVPLTLVWFGTGESQKIGFLAIATFVFLLPVVVKAIRDVDDILVRTAATQGATRAQIVTKVLLPVAWPDIYNGLRVGFGVAWSWIILAEVVAAERGLGFIINVAQSRGTNMGIVYLTLATIVLLAFALDRLWALGFQALFPYRRGSHE